MQKLGLLAVFAFVIIVVGMAIGIGFPPGEWYAALQKPWFTPPNAAFGPIWTILYIFIAIAGWRTWISDSGWQRRGPWFGQMILNFLWTPIFFGAHMTALGLVVIIGVWLCVLLFIIRAWQADRISALLFVPYLIWLSLATALNAAIVVLN
ncbi:MULTISPECIES: TspO/MBR family protein [Brucella/Ochrobactrum group]|jgi:tryptophan-rich sensory protein|uniref:TspO/MBR family protein n=1 Tax=Brucella/Ochrobactrum group TaxID=2826938 RepID=UPI001C059597|nr:TspO/MBR family protein [Brucella sp. NBRC 12950]QWK79905.1 tryptophan-rich sensory protein [Ochrobactrum sp. BTU1]GLU27224.1 tryptophan-rich sensory protein [Brucella sp. NBRC 12950]